MKNLTPKFSPLSLATTRMGTMRCQVGPMCENNPLDARQAQLSPCNRSATGAAKRALRMEAPRRRERMQPNGHLMVEATIVSQTLYLFLPCAVISKVARVGRALAETARTQRSQSLRCPKVSLKGQRSTRFKKRVMNCIQCSPQLSLSSQISMANKWLPGASAPSKPLLS